MNTPEVTPSPERRFFYADSNNQSIGPIPFARLQSLASEGIVRPDTFVIAEGDSEWTTYQSISGFPTPPSPPPLASSEEKTGRRWPAVLCVLLFYPLGLIALWLSKGFSRNQKAILTVASLLTGALFIALQRPGFLFAVLLINSLLFAWWARKLGKVAKVAITVLVILLFLPPALMNSERSIRKTPPVASAPAMPPSPALASSSPSEEIASSEPLKIREKFRLGDFTYAILGTSRQSAVGDRYTSATASPGALFLVVQYSIKNESNKTRTVLSDDFILRDGKGREFSPSSKAISALLLSGEQQDMILRELQPGITNRTLTAFEIPTDALRGELVLIVPEKGWGGSKKHVLVKAAATTNL